MKKIYTFFAFLFFIGINFDLNAQLSGPKSIPGDYATIALAISDLNSQGVGSGGVIFNVAGGHSETSANIVISITSNQPTASNPVVFQKSGTGANPLIIAAPGVSATLDGIIKFSGADYITFDAIDLLDPSSNTGNAVMEWGYALMRSSTTDGSRNNVIKNCTITLQKINSLSIGIYIINKDTLGTTITAVDSSGQNNRNRLYGNSISNVYHGINVIASSLTRDIDNEIGVTGLAPNNITNWGGSTITCEGVRCEGQVNVKINNNIINGGNGTGGSAATIGIIATLFGTTALAPNYEISYNQVTVVTNSTSQATYGIRALATGNTILIHHNIVENCNSPQTTSAFNGIAVDQIGTSNAVYIYNNIVRNNSHSGTGSSNLLAGGGTSGFINYLSIRANQIYGNRKTGISGTMNCIPVTDAFVICDSNIVYDNSIPNSSGTTPSVVYGYINNGNPTTTEVVANNEIYNLSVGGTNTSASSVVAGIRANSGASTLKEIYGNTIHTLTGVSGTTTTGGVIGIWSTAGTSTKIYANKIYDLTNNGATSTTAGCWVTSGTSLSIYNNFISNLKTPNSSNNNAVMGINCTSTAANSSIGLYYNSIYLTAAGASTFGSSGISVTANATVTAAVLDLRDNIIINLSTPGSSSGSSIAFRRSSSALGNFAAVSDYNNFYSGSPAANRLIFFDGTNSDQTLAGYQARVSPRDANSKSVAVNFVDPANGDLHLTGPSIGDHNLIGTPVSGITTDIDGTTRSTGYPYKGADESNAFTFPTLNLTINLEAYSPEQDTVVVLLRDVSFPFTVIDSANGYLSPAGTVSLEYPNAVDGVNYYIVVKHRNSIETWSKSGGEVFSGGILNYNFTSSASQAYEGNQVLVGSKYSIFTGDVNQDGFVELTDIVMIFNDGSTFATGYVVTDLNGDEIVDLTDLTYAFNNASSFVTVKTPL